MDNSSSKPSDEITKLSSKRAWEKPVLSKLPRLTELTLQTGGAIPGGGTGGGTVF